MKMINMRFVLLCAFLLPALLMLSSCDGFAQRRSAPLLRTESPDSVYVVQLIGRADRPVFFGTNILEIEVLKNGESYVKPEFFHSARHMDLPFNTGYSRHKWVDKNVIHFYRTRHDDSKTIVRIAVTNNSGSNIRFLKVFSTDKMLLLDLADGATQLLDCSEPLGDFIGFFVEGQLADGHRLKHGTSFPWRDAEDTSYIIEILRDSIIITNSK